MRTVLERSTSGITREWRLTYVLTDFSGDDRLFTRRTVFWANEDQEALGKALGILKAAARRLRRRELMVHPLYEVIPDPKRTKCSDLFYLVPRYDLRAGSERAEVLLRVMDPALCFLKCVD